VPDQQKSLVTQKGINTDHSASNLSTKTLTISLCLFHETQRTARRYQKV